MGRQKVVPVALVVAVFTVAAGYAAFVTKPRSSASLATAAGPVSLTADAGHDVLVIPECDLALRYNKKNSAPVTVFVNTSKDGKSGYYFRADRLQSLQVYEDYSTLDMERGSDGPARIGIECSPSGVLAAGSAKSIFSSLFVKENTLSAVSVAKDAFCKMVGLEVRSCGKVTNFKTFNAIGKKGQYKIFVWDNGSLSYIVGDKSRGAITTAFQINSLAPAKPSVNLSDPIYSYYKW